jgi:hypothetical protein
MTKTTITYRTIYSYDGGYFDAVAWFDTREERDAYRKEQQELNRPRKQGEPMRVKDLIKILKGFDGNTRVRLFDEACGIIDITEVQEAEGVFKGDLVIV